MPTNTGRKMLTDRTKQFIRDLADTMMYDNEEIAALAGVSTTSVWYVLHPTKKALHTKALKMRASPRHPFTSPRVTDPSLLGKLTAGR